MKTRVGYTLRAKVFYSSSPEPTNNVPPKSSGRKIEGSIVSEVNVEKTAVVPCDVSGYPVPRFR